MLIEQTRGEVADSGGQDEIVALGTPLGTASSADVSSIPAVTGDGETCASFMWYSVRRMGVGRTMSPRPVSLRRAIRAASTAATASITLDSIRFAKDGLPNVRL